MIRGPIIRWNEITAAFGGSFDPPHRGHRLAVEGLLHEPGVARVLVLPSPVPIQKTSVATREQRLEMVRLCFSGLPGVSINTSELERADRNPGQPAYSFDTIQELKREIPKFAFVIGADQLSNLPTWHRFPEILRECHWIVLTRKSNRQDSSSHSAQDSLPEALKILSQWEASGLVKPSGIENDTCPVWQTGRLATGPAYLRITPTDAPAAASTDIRRQIAVTGSPPEGLLEPAVQAYLKAHRIYGIREA